MIHAFALPIHAPIWYTTDRRLYSWDFDSCTNMGCNSSPSLQHLGIRISLPYFDSCARVGCNGYRPRDHKCVRHFDSCLPIGMRLPSSPLTSVSTISIRFPHPYRMQRAAMQAHYNYFDSCTTIRMQPHHHEHKVSHGISIHAFARDGITYIVVCSSLCGI